MIIYRCEDHKLRLLIATAEGKLLIYDIDVQSGGEYTLPFTIHRYGGDSLFNHLYDRINDLYLIL